MAQVQFKLRVLQDSGCRGSSSELRCRPQCGTTHTPSFIYKRWGQAHREVVLPAREQTNVGLERLMNRCNICLSPLHDIESYRGSCSHSFFFFFEPGKSSQAAVDSVSCIWQNQASQQCVTGVVHFTWWFLHVQLCPRLRHMKLTDARNDGPESLKQCCIMFGTASLRCKEVQ